MHVHVVCEDEQTIMGKSHEQHWQDDVWCERARNWLNEHLAAGVSPPGVVDSLWESESRFCVQSKLLKMS